jgi:SAM-dependent methyltransferase
MSDPGSAIRLHDTYDHIEAQFNQALDESLDPVGPESLYDHVAAMRLPAGATAIDVGCGTGRHAVRLATRFGLHVIGIDPGSRHGQATSPGEGGSVIFRAGTVEDLPVPAGTADLVWCRDVLSLVADLDRAYREFRRVLRPGGRALIYQTFATSLLEPAEAAFLIPVMGCVPESMRPERTETAIADAGLHIDRCLIVGTEWGEHVQEHAQAPGRHLLHAARLIRDPDRYITRFGRENYDIKLGDCLWHIYRMIGKLSGRIYLLSAPVELPHDQHQDAANERGHHDDDQQPHRREPVRTACARAGRHCGSWRRPRRRRCGALASHHPVGWAECQGWRGLGGRRPQGTRQGFPRNR